MAFDRKQYGIDYKKKNYERISVLFPIGEKDKIKSKAEELGLSAGEFIRQAINEKMNK